MGALSRCLWVPGPLPALNNLLAAAKGFRGRGIGYARLKRQWTDTVWALAKQARLPRYKRARFHFQWVELNRRRDPDNIAAAGRKLVFDGLVKAGVLEGDGWSYIHGWNDEFVLGTIPGVYVTIDGEAAL